MAEKLSITAALTGAVAVPTQNPHLPFAPEHQIADAESCVKADASDVHLYACDPETGQPSSYNDLLVYKGVLAINAQRVRKAIRLVKKRDREIVTPTEMRAMLGLKGRGAITFSTMETIA